MITKSKTRLVIKWTPLVLFVLFVLFIGTFALKCYFITKPILKFNSDNHGVNGARRIKDRISELVY